MEVLYPQCAGLDVHSRRVYAWVLVATGHTVRHGHDRASGVRYHDGGSARTGGMADRGVAVRRSAAPNLVITRAVHPARRVARPAPDAARRAGGRLSFPPGRAGRAHVMERGRVSR